MEYDAGFAGLADGVSERAIVGFLAAEIKRLLDRRQGHVEEL